MCRDSDLGFKGSAGTLSWIHSRLVHSLHTEDGGINRWQWCTSPRNTHIPRAGFESWKVTRRYIALNQALVLSWWRMQRIEEDDYGGTQALMGEGLPPSIGLFVVSFWQSIVSPIVPFKI